MVEALSNDMDSMQGISNTIVGELIEKNNVLEVTVLVLKEQMLDLV